VGWPGPRRWPESNRLRQRLQGVPATLAVTPADRLRHHLPRPAVCMVLTLWTCQLSSLHERLSERALWGRSIRPELNETARRDFPLERLRASACSRLPANHSAGQGSRKPRRRIHVSGPLRRLARGHVSMVSRWRKPGQLYFPGIPRCGDGAWALDVTLAFGGTPTLAGRVSLPGGGGKKRASATQPPPVPRYAMRLPPPCRRYASAINPSA
jgi:hypothetical protein